MRVARCRAPVTGAVDVVTHGVTGILGEYLRAEALKHTWAESSRQFSNTLVPTG